MLPCEAVRGLGAIDGVGLNAGAFVCGIDGTVVLVAAADCDALTGTACFPEKEDEVEEDKACRFAGGGAWLD